MVPWYLASFGSTGAKTTFEPLAGPRQGRCHLIGSRLCGRWRRARFLRGRLSRRPLGPDARDAHVAVREAYDVLRAVVEPDIRFVRVQHLRDRARVFNTCERLNP